MDTNPQASNETPRRGGVYSDTKGWQEMLGLGLFGVFLTIALSCKLVKR